jgi:hypothetical protein
MLHPVSDSIQRRRLLRVVVLQRRLIRALCKLPPGSGVDQAWLVSVWKGIDPGWIQGFWENEKAVRARWLNIVAEAGVADKQSILQLSTEQLRFRELWASAPTITMRRGVWGREPFGSLNALLKSFYAPLFYSVHGYVFGDGRFDKEVFLGGFPANGKKVCAYCDNHLQKIELDHFLPKDHFPFISCHPDNLIPSCHDSNNNKGTAVPLDWNDHVDQASGWFHPRWRSSTGRLKVDVTEVSERRLAVTLGALDPSDGSRVTNLDVTFRISRFWSEKIEDELQLIGSQVSDLLREEHIEPTEEAVRAKLQSLAHLKKGEIGRRGLAMCHHALYSFAANTPAVVSDIARSCQE